MNTETALTILMAFFTGGWLLALALRKLAHWGTRFRVRIGRWVKPVKPDFQIRDVPLSYEKWQRFGSLAIAKGKSQRALLAEAIEFYLQEKVK